MVIPSLDIFLSGSMFSDNGNTTYYEYLYGEKPNKIEEAVITVDDDIKVCNFYNIHQ